MIFFEKEFWIYTNLVSWLPFTGLMNYIFNTRTCKVGNLSSLTSYSCVYQFCWVSCVSFIRTDPSSRIAIWNVHDLQLPYVSGDVSDLPPGWVGRKFESNFIISEVKRHIQSCGEKWGDDCHWLFQCCFFFNVHNVEKYTISE